METRIEAMWKQVQRVLSQRIAMNLPDALSPIGIRFDPWKGEWEDRDGINYSSEMIVNLLLVDPLRLAEYELYQTSKHPETTE